MNGTDKNKELASTLENEVTELLKAMSNTLNEKGFSGLRVVSFAVQEIEAAPMALAAGTPCPVRCVVLPDGRVRCEPQC